MDRRTRATVVLALGALIALTAGAAILRGGGGLPDPDRPSGDRTLVGVIVAVDAASLTRVRGFTLRTSDGTTTTFASGNLENGDEFPPGHLVEHQATAVPVRVWYRVEGTRNVAVRLEDAT